MRIPISSSVRLICRWYNALLSLLYLFSGKSVISNPNLKRNDWLYMGVSQISHSRICFPENRLLPIRFWNEMIGYVCISIRSSDPQLKKRVPWQGLVVYGEVWPVHTYPVPLFYLACCIVICWASGAGFALLWNASIYEALISTLARLFFLTDGPIAVSRLAGVKNTLNESVLKQKTKTK